MRSRPFSFALALVLVIAATATASWRSWRKQQVRAIARAAIPALPPLDRWPAGFERELRLVSAAAAHGPNSIEPMGRLAMLYQANGFTAQATQLLAALHEIDRANPHWPYLLAILAQRRGDSVVAETLLATATKLDPAYAPAWLRLGDAFAARAGYREARAAYARAQQLAPDLVQAQFATARLQALSGRMGDPRPLLQVLTARHPEIVEIHALSARVRAAAGDAAGAGEERRLAEAAPWHLPSDDPWLDEVARFDFDSNRLARTARRLAGERRSKEAEALLLRAIALSPLHPALRIALADVYLGTGRTAEARAALGEAVAEIPEAPELPDHLSDALRREHNATAAVSVARRAVERWPARASLQAALGLALRDAGETDAAILSLEDALQRDPVLVEARYALAFCRLAKREPAPARRAAEQALALRPDYTPALILLGGLMLDANDIAGAEKIVAQLHRLRADEPGSRLLFAGLQLIKGKQLDEGGNLEMAARCYRDGLAVSPDMTALLRESGLLATRRAQFPEAEEAFEHYIRLEPRDLDGYLWLGKTYEENGKTAEAGLIFERGLAMAKQLGNASRTTDFSVRLDALDNAR